MRRAVFFILFFLNFCNSSFSTDLIINDGNNFLLVELADTPEKRQIGYMYRPYIPFWRGMLFKFDNETFPVSFWMKNTISVLEMSFYSSSGIKHTKYKAYPCAMLVDIDFDDCPNYDAKLPTSYVLETPIHRYNLQKEFKNLKGFIFFSE